MVKGAKGHWAPRSLKELEYKVHIGEIRPEEAIIYNKQLIHAVLKHDAKAKEKEDSACKVPSEQQLERLRWNRRSQTPPDSMTRSGTTFDTSPTRGIRYPLQQFPGGGAARLLPGVLVRSSSNLEDTTERDNGDSVSPLLVGATPNKAGADDSRKARVWDSDEESSEDSEFATRRSASLRPISQSSIRGELHAVIQEPADDQLPVMVVCREERSGFAGLSRALPYDWMREVGSQQHQPSAYGWPSSVQGLFANVNSRGERLRSTFFQKAGPVNGIQLSPLKTKPKKPEASASPRRSPHKMPKDAVLTEGWRVKLPSSHLERCTVGIASAPLLLGY